MSEWDAVEVVEVKRKRRVFLWVFLAVQALFLLWIILGTVSTSGDPVECVGADPSCNDAYDAGRAVGAFFLLVLWFIVDGIMLAVYGVWRMTRRSS